MPFALATIGLLLIVSGARDTYQAFGSQLQKDFTGPGNFTYWIVALGSVGALGYSDTLRPFSRAFMALIIVAIFLSKGGFFQQFQSALASGPVQPVTAASNTGAASVLPGASSSQPGNTNLGAPIINLGPLGSVNATPGGFVDNWMQHPLIGGGGWLSGFWSSLFGGGGSQ